LPALIANRYVASEPWVDFWGYYFAYLRKLAQELFGHETLADEALLAAVVLIIGLLRWLPRPQLRQAAPALFVLLLPLLLLPLQRVHAPTRVLLYLVFFFFVAAAHCGDWLLSRLRPAPLRALLLVGGLVAAYGAYQARNLRWSVLRSASYDASMQQVYGWLRQQRARRVYYEAPLHKLFHHHYATMDRYPMQLFEASSAQGSRYDLVVEPRLGTTPSWLQPAHYRTVYTDDRVIVYAPASAPAPARPEPGLSVSGTED
jgi:hypothetical protein